MKDELLDRFLKEALPKIVQKFKPSKIIVFGSRVRGNARSDSDIDVIVVSDRFKNIPFIRRMPMLLRLVRFDQHIDFLCYTEEEFERIKDESAVVKSAMESGVVV